MVSKQNKVQYVREKMKAKPGDHKCHWPGCGASVAPALWGCKTHWMMLPKEIRDRIWKTYKPGQEVKKNPTWEYLKAAGAAEAWIVKNHPPAGLRVSKTTTTEPDEKSKLSTRTTGKGSGRVASSSSTPTPYNPNPILLIDTNNLAWRAQHTTGKFSHKGKMTGVAYGVLRELEKLKDKFGPGIRPVFLFDKGRPKRLELYPEYKANRELDEERQSVRDQVDRLRRVILPRMGYRNVFAKKGFEADDLLAAISDSYRGNLGVAVIIVSGDHDFYQCLGLNVTQYQPIQNRVYTAKALEDEFGIPPGKWARVKAMAGCTTDNIVGIKGVGEKTAAAYVAGTIKPGKQYDKIKAAKKLVKRNLELVKLPFPGTPVLKLRKDSVTDKKRQRVFKLLGIRSLGV